MVKQTRKYIETGMRKTAEEAGNKGRSMTHEAIGRATRLSGDIVSLFLALIEKDMPYPRGAGSRILPDHVQQAYHKLVAAIQLGLVYLERGEEE